MTLTTEDTTTLKPFPKLCIQINKVNELLVTNHLPRQGFRWQEHVSQWLWTSILLHVYGE